MAFVAIFWLQEKSRLWNETCHTWEPQTLMVKCSFPFFHLSVWGCSICSFRHNFHRSVNNATLQPPSLRWWLFSGKMEWKTRKENTFLISGLGGGLRQFLFWLLGYFFLGTWGYSRLHNHTCKHCLTIFLIWMFYCLFLIVEHQTSLASLCIIRQGP